MDAAADHHRSAWQIGFAHFRGFMLFGIAIGGLALASLLFVRQTADTQLQRLLVQRLNDQLQAYDMTATINAVRLEPQRGIRIKRITIRKNIAPIDEPLLVIDELFVKASVSLPDLLLSPPQIEALLVRGAAMHLNMDHVTDLDWPTLIQSALDSEYLGAFPIVVSDGRYLMSWSDSGSRHSLRVANINLAVPTAVETPAGPVLRARGDLTASFLHSARWQSEIHLATANFQLQTSLDGLQLQGNLLNMLPQGILPPHDINQIGGQLDLRADLKGALTPWALSDYRLEAQWRDGILQSNSLPYPLTNAQAEVIVTPGGWQVPQATARSGVGHISLSYRQSGWDDRRQWRCQGRVERLTFDQRLVEALPPALSEWCEDFAPTGSVDVDFSLAGDASSMHPEVEMQLHDVSFSFHRFPFRFQQSVGTVSWIGSRLEVDLQSLEADAIVAFKGAIDLVPDSWLGEIRIWSQGHLPIDDRLFKALQHYPNLIEAIAELRPGGRVGGRGRLFRDQPQDAVGMEFDLLWAQGTVRPVKYDYPLHNINGVLRVRDGGLSFESLTAASGSGHFECHGTWSPDEGLVAQIEGHHVALDESLRRALSPSVQRVWDGMRPRGSLDRLVLNWRDPPGDAPTEISVVAEVHAEGGSTANLAIRPTWFPYELNHLSGRLRMAGGQIRLESVRAQRGRTWFTCQGDGYFDEDDWLVRLTDIVVGGLVIDEELLQAMPESLAAACRQLQFRGLLNVSGEVVMTSQSAPEPFRPEPVPVGRAMYITAGRSSGPHAAPELAYNLRLDVEQGALRAAVPVTHISGAVRAIGYWDQHDAKCYGHIDLDSLMFNGVQVTRVQGPFSIEREQVAGGSWAKLPPPAALRMQGNPFEAGSAVPSSGYSALTPAAAPSIMGRTLGGRIALDGRMNRDEEGRFSIRTSLVECDLREAAEELAPGLTRVQGKGFATIELSGSRAGTHTLRGQGNVGLRDAQLSELPLVLALLKALRVSEINRSAFDAGNISLVIHGEDIDLRRIELIGDAFSLIGNGKVNLQRQVHLDFYSVAGRNQLYIPILTQLYRAGSQQILWIKVSGPLDRPQIKREVLPGLNDSLRQLLEELELRPTQ